MEETAKNKTRYFEGVGKRKSAVARVRLVPAAKTTYLINGKNMGDYFPVVEHRRFAEEVFEKVNLGKHFSVSILARGGGISSQAVAVRLGVARALLSFDKSLRKELKPKGFLTRDGRTKERRKFGLKKARKAPQWSKR